MTIKNINEKYTRSFAPIEKKITNDHAQIVPRQGANEPSIFQTVKARAVGLNQN